MGARLTTPRAVKGRGNTVPCTLALDRDAYELLQTLAPSRKTFGSFLSGLVRAEQARRDERRRIGQAILEGHEASSR